MGIQTKTDISPPLFSQDDADRAYEEWGLNCGPAAIAAVLGLTLDQVRPHLGDFEQKRFTNPTLMWQILRSLKAPFHHRPDKQWPDYGLVRIQWEGPWTKPGVPIRARYRQTHWVGAARRGGEVGVFDVNCLNNGSGWVSLEEWKSILVPWLLSAAVPRASGAWHITHSVEIAGNA